VAWLVPPGLLSVALTHLSLFTGLGGFEVGMRLAGVDYRTVGYCEIDRYCQEIIKARIRDGQLDDAPIWPDIRTIPCDEYQGLVDVITGGFPCQDISNAGRGAGLDGEQSGLWWEMLRVIGDIRPRYVILENVAAIYVWGVDRVLGSLAAIGYDCEWHLVSAEAAGAPHLRKRWWCLAADATVIGLEEQIVQP
jgi:DNA (cytosine-5)-methyltransferase 1